MKTIEDICFFDDFYNSKKIFITGHTGFKGSWLCLMLNALGANVIGYAKDIKTPYDNFNLSGLSKLIIDIRGDILDSKKLIDSMKVAKPEIVFHLAAQPLVRYSYENPGETYLSNVIGTLNVLDAVRETESVKVVVVVTTDKCYQNNEWYWGYREDDRLGGHDPYSSSKACAELLTASYRESFFKPKDRKSKIAIATVRAGNVIGGGDWSQDRIIPDCIKSFINNEPVILRNPSSVRPWQHVLEPLFGYILLAARMYYDPIKYSQAFNFGPNTDGCVPVKHVVEKLIESYGIGSFIAGNTEGAHEAKLLSLDISKSKAMLGWQPVWNIDKAIEKTAEWYKYFKTQDVYELCLRQIKEFIRDCSYAE